MPNVKFGDARLQIAGLGGFCPLIHSKGNLWAARHSGAEWRKFKRSSCRLHLRPVSAPLGKAERSGMIVGPTRYFILERSPQHAQL